MKIRRILTLVLMAGLAFGASGCTYMQNRGNDFSQIIDGGVTTSSEPQLSIYAGFLNVIALGYSDFDGNLHGLVDGDAGTHHAVHKTWGAVLVGREELAYAPAPTEFAPETEPWGASVGMAFYGPPPKGQIINCPKLLHLGWAGLAVNCHVDELADFLLGITTLDIMDDDMRE